MESNMAHIKNQIKKIKPDFVRQDAHKKKRLKAGWRWPKGHHSKMRERRKGHPVVVDVGYRTPKGFRGKIGGMDVVVVHNLDELKRIDVKKHSVIISKMGLKKRIELLKECKKIKANVLNFSVDKFLKSVEEKIKAKKEVKEKGSKEEKEVKERKKEELTAEEKEKKEKEEKDKILTKAR